MPVTGSGEREGESIEEVLGRVRAGRSILGMSAILLPFTPEGSIDWDGLAAHIGRTAEAGLIPAVNMDTGYVQVLDDDERARVLEVARATAGGEFVAGAHVADEPGAAFDVGAYARELDRIQRAGGLPVVFPSYGLSALEGADWVGAHARLGRGCPRLLGFELGSMFVPYGRIVDLDTYAALLDVPECIGAKHSSLSRSLEWQRLSVRDARRPDFRVLTGNDLAIDMVMYGSDYLLGLSTFAPDLFARRDRLWEQRHPGFFELNDALQALGDFSFRDPVPGYRHDAAMFLHLRGWTASDRTHPRAPQRPASDREVLAGLARRLGVSP